MAPTSADSSHKLLNYFTVWNIFGLLPRTVQTKVPFVQDLLSSRDQLFVILTETWLRDHKDAELMIEGYMLFRADRQRPRKRRGRDSGGVAIYLRQDLAVDAEPVMCYSNGVIEILGLHSKSRNLLLIGLYRQPDDPTGGNRSTSKEFVSALSELKEKIILQGNPTPDIVLCGDFNLPNAAWPYGTPGNGCSKDEREMLDALKEFTSEFFLYQKITSSTHKRGNILDLLFTNNPLFLHSYDCTNSQYSDHSIVECATTFEVKCTENLSSDGTDDTISSNWESLN